jgi:hypothetical protein
VLLKQDSGVRVIEIETVLFGSLQSREFPSSMEVFANFRQRGNGKEKWVGRTWNHKRLQKVRYSADQREVSGNDLVADSQKSDYDRGALAVELGVDGWGNLPC